MRRILTVTALLIGIVVTSSSSTYAATSISYGQAVSGSLSVAGEQDEFTFTCAGGDKVKVNFVVTGGSFTPHVTLIDPSGYAVWSNGSMVSFINVSGTARFRVRDTNNSATGSYAFTIQRIKNPVGASSLPMGQITSGSITAPAQLKAYTFSSNAGDRFILRYVKTGGTGQYGTLELFDPSGNYVYNYYSTYIPLEFTASQTGTYTLFMGDYTRQATQSYELFLQRRNNPGSAAALAPGQTISASTTSRIQSAAYKITAAQGQIMQLNATRTSTTSGYFTPYLELCDPSGMILNNTTGGNIWRVMPVSGSYAVFLTDTSLDGTGAYTISLTSFDDNLTVFGTGPYEVYGLNERMDSRVYLNMNASGKVKYLGSGTATKTFPYENFKFYAVVTKSYFTLDAMQLPGGKFLLSNTTYLGNVHRPLVFNSNGMLNGTYGNYANWPAVYGQPDNQTAQVGFPSGINATTAVPSTYKGYVVASNPLYTETMTGYSSHEATQAEPVYLQNGDFVYEKTDLSIPALGMPLEIKRTYKSLSIADSAFGFGWEMNYHQRVSPLLDGGAYWYDGTGKWNYFQGAGGGNYTSPAYSYETLKRNADGTWVITRKDRTVLNFDVNGCLAEVRDRNGNKLTFTYSGTKKPVIGIPFGQPGAAAQETASDWQLLRVTDAANRSLTFGYNTNGRLSSVSDFTGRSVTYTYDGNGDLVEVKYPATAQFTAGTTIRYSYANHNLLTITDAKGQRYLQNFYNIKDQVERQIYGNATYDFWYDTANRKTEMFDGNSNYAVYNFNENGLPVYKEEFTRGLRAGDPDRFTVWTQYNAKMEKVREYFPRGNSVAYDYDANGNLLNVTRISHLGEPSLVSRFTYEPNYNFVKTAADPKGGLTTYYYDYEEAVLGDLNGDNATGEARGNLVKTAAPAVGSAAAELKFVYNTAGQVVKAIDANAVITQNAYNATTGYVLNTTRDPGGLNITTSYTYDAAGNVKTVKDPKGIVTTFNYDSHNNLLSTVSPAPFNYTTVNTYDANDNLVKAERSTGNASDPWQTSEMTYDPLDRVVSVKNDLGFTTSYTYDANGNKVSITDANGNVTRYHYDERNLLWKTTDALNQVTEYAYDENRNLKAIKDARGYVTTFAYDGFDRQTAMTYPDGTNETTAYDANSNAVSTKNAAGQVITYAYDALNRLTKKTYPNASAVNYTYDIGSRLTKITDASGSINNTYDKANRLTKVVYPGNRTVQYAYDKNSNRVRLTYPDASSLNYTYDNLNRLTGITSGGAAVANYTYDLLSQRSKAGLANGIEAVYGYDGAGRLLSLVNRVTTAPATVISQFNYAYDNAGNRKSVTAPSGVHNYSYDKTYQLKIADYPTGFFAADTTFNFDAAGNRASVVTNTTTSYAVNNLNQYSAVAGGAHTYDANGNLKTGGGWTYGYDYDDRLVTAAKTGVNATYAYDSLGRRTSKAVGSNVTVFVYDGDQVIAEYNGTGALQAKYVYGTGIDEVLTMWRGNQTYYYHYDGLGSVSEITNTTAVKRESYSYDAYGRVQMKNATGGTITTSSVGNRNMFTGREYDAETGIYHYRARAYSPTLGRFLQRDPAGMPDGTNRYTYALNAPMNWVDPLGLCKEDKGWGKAFTDLFFDSHTFRSSIDLWQAAGNDYGLKTIALVGMVIVPADAALSIPAGEVKAGIKGLSKAVVQSFRSGKYRTIILESDVVAFRYFGGKSKAMGNYLTTEQTARMISSPAEAKRILNLPSGNTADQLGQYIIPKGTQVSVGRVEGGAARATQIVVDDYEVLRRVQ